MFSIKDDQRGIRSLVEQSLAVGMHKKRYPFLQGHLQFNTFLKEKSNMNQNTNLPIFYYRLYILFIQHFPPLLSQAPR